MELINKIFKKGEKFGDIQVAISKENTLSLEYKGNKIDNSEESSVSEIAIRIIKGNKFGFSKTTDLMRWEDCLKNAVKIMKVSEPFEHKLPVPEIKKTNFVSGVYSKEVAEADEKFLFEKGKELISKPKAKELNIPHASVERNIIENIFAVSGEEINERYTYFGANIECNAGESLGSEFRVEHGFFDASEIGDQAMRLCLEGRNPQKAPTEKMDLVMDYNAFSRLVGKILVPSLSGDSVAFGKSYLGDKQNKKVFSEKLSVVDDGRMKNGLFSTRFDAEGVPTQKTNLIDDGVVKNFMFDSYTAKMLNQKTTGNCSTLEKVPSVSPSNFIMAEGDFKNSEIVEETKRGIVSHYLMGTHVANEITGDASVAIENSYLIENGQKKHPVKQAMIHLNLFDALKNLEVVGNKIRQDGNIGVPWVKFSNVQIIG